MRFAPQRGAFPAIGLHAAARRPLHKLTHMSSMELPSPRPIGGLRLHSLVFVTNYQPSVVDVAAWSNPDSRVHPMVLIVVR